MNYLSYIFQLAGYLAGLFFSLIFILFFTFTLLKLRLDSTAWKTVFVNLMSFRKALKNRAPQGQIFA
jgi:hypothetical protein